MNEALVLYEETFDDIFPMMMFSGSREEDVIEIINKCIKANKDVYDMGYLSLDEIY